MTKRFILLLTIVACLLTGCTPPTIPTSQPIEKDHHIMYAKSHLNKEQKEDYDAIFNTFMKLEKKTYLHADSENAILKVLNAVLADHPEIFWTTEFQYTSSNNNPYKMKFIPVYDYTEDEIEDYNEQLELISKQILKGIDKTATDYEKVKYIYDFIINQTDYIEDAPDSQNIISSLINKASVCAGYAKGIQYLLSQMDIECSFITGKAIENKIGHAWNMVKMNDEYYYIDATYGDSENSQTSPIYRYIYFGMTSVEISELYYEIAPHEITDAKDNSYASINNHYFTSYDENKIQQAVLESVKTGNHSILLKCDSITTLQILHRKLTKDYEIFKMLEEIGMVQQNVNYYMKPELNTLLYFY